VYWIGIETVYFANAVGIVPSLLMLDIKENVLMKIAVRYEVGFFL